MAVVFEFGGKQDPMVDHSTKPEKALCLTAAKVEAPRSFEIMLPSCKPKATPSRSYSSKNQTFIKEVTRLLANEIIEPSRCLRQSKVLVVRNPTKLSFVIDCSQTVNRYTLLLNAYPPPKIDEIVNKASNDRFYSSLYLKPACHQVPLLERERGFLMHLRRWKTLPLPKFTIWCI